MREKNKKSWLNSLREEYNDKIMPGIKTKIARCPRKNSFKWKLIKILNNSRKTLGTWENWPRTMSTLRHTLIKLLDFKDKEKMEITGTRIQMFLSTKRKIFKEQIEKSS